MIIGIVGLPNCGKTTLFNALTKGEAETAPYHQAGAEANIGIVKVPDARVDRLSEIFKPKKTTHATVEFVDLPGLPRGSVAEGTKVTDFLKRAREVDALVHVVRAFEDDTVPHPAGSVDPLRDVEDLEVELILSDLAIIEKRLERVEAALKKGVEKGKHEKEKAILDRFRTALEEEKPLRNIVIEEAEEKLIRGYRFLTLQPLIIVLNVGEGEIGSEKADLLAKDVASRFPGEKSRVELLSAKIEMEMGQLPADEATLFMEDLGLTESAMERLIHTCYDLLGRISFLTAGEDEVRAWTIPKETPAVQAAGAIHSDIERGFIKAEAITFNDFIAVGSFAKAREAGTLRLEGRDYIVRDGEIVHFKFNV
ncbi:MAG: redox-regulated ATPase YchF [Deltaproteobacteria bacterium]|nr:redox-regulated ATPase YchF [Deltaproteobacteria bacterium]